MANVSTSYVIGTTTLYFLVRNSDGNYWDGDSWEDIAGGTYGDYATAMSDAKSVGLFIGAFPAVAAGDYTIIIKVGAGAASDPVVASAIKTWDGTSLSETVTTDADSRAASKATSVEVSDKTGFSLADIDGIDSEKALAAILAAVLGKCEPSGNMVPFKRRDGTTTVATVTLDPATPGKRTASVITDE